MNERNYRKYSQEFKLEALELLRHGDKSAGQIERELGITPGMLLKWRARYQAVQKSGTAVRLEPSDLESAKAEIRRLQRALADAQALYQHQGPIWEEWNNRMRPILVNRQVTQGEHAGSWNPGGQWAGQSGRAVTTALATLSLEVYYRYLPLYGAQMARGN